eukprot:jgi/Ulvmu1/10553/UM065_0007.1
MAALGLAGYSSSESDDEGSELHLRNTSNEGRLGDAPSRTPVLHAHVMDTASVRVASDNFNAFGNKRVRARRSRAGLPLFSKPVDMGQASDGEDSTGERYKKPRHLSVGHGDLSFLPHPVHALPPLDQAVEEPVERAAPQSRTSPCVDTSEMYRVDTDGFVSAATTLHSTLLRPEASLAESMNAGQHIEFKEIRADVIQRASPHEKSEVDAMRTAMGSEHAKHVQASAGQHMPSKRQKQRHQLNSLYHKAQMTELQDMERKLVHTRSKAQTAAKYGW